jgi:hypothetical protein
MNDKITSEYLLNFLERIYNKRHAHKDYHELHTKQLKTLTKFLDIDGCIVFDYESKTFNIKRLNKDFIRTDIMNEKKYTNLDSAERVITQHINHLFELISKERTIRSSGQMTTFDDMELVHKILQSRKNDFAISAMNDAIVKIYRNSILESFSLLFSPQYSSKNKQLKRYKINEILDDETQEIMNLDIDDYDYF